MDQGNGWGPLYGACQDNSKSPPELCTCFSDAAVHLFPDCPLYLANTTYYFGGQSVNVKANLTYKYIVNVSLPVSVIGFQEYVNELQVGDITLQDFTSEYTGGPAKATLFTQQQPARNDIPFMVIAAIYNDGSGEIARFYSPSGLAVDKGGTVWVADRSNHALRKITNDGTVLTVAGNGVAGYAFYTDPYAPLPNAKANNHTACLKLPDAVTVDAYGNVYISYHLTQPAKVSLAVFDVQGRLVRELVNSRQVEGSYSSGWDLRRLDGLPVPAGVYFIISHPAATDKVENW
jgi:hypothetical protein